MGDNLMSRYRAIASFQIWNSVCQTAMDASRALLAARGVATQTREFDEFWSDFATYVRLQHATGQTEAEILAPVEATLSYDIAQWLADGDLTDPSPYRLAEPTRFVFELTDEGRDELHRSLAVWTTHSRGLSKLVTRVKVESQIRHCRPRDPVAMLAARHATSRAGMHVSA